MDYDVKSPDGTTLTISGDSPPTESQLKDIFDKAAQRTKTTTSADDDSGYLASAKKVVAGMPSAIAKGLDAIMVPVRGAAAMALNQVATSAQGDVPPIGNTAPVKAVPGQNLVNLPQVSKEDIKLLPKPLQVVAGVANSIDSALSSLTEPGNLLVAPVAGIEGMAKPIATGFLAQTIASEPKAVQDAWTTYNDPKATTAEKSSAIANAALINPVFAGLLAHGLVSKPVEPSLTPLTDQALKEKGEPNAETIRSDTKQPSEPRTPVEGSQADSGGNIQQAPSGTPDATGQTPETNVTTPVTENQSQPVETPPAEPSTSAPSPTPPAEDITALKYKLIDQQRVEQGLEPLPKPETEGDKQVADEAKAMVAKNPNLPEQLVEEINNNPRSLSPAESIVMLNKLAEVKNERNTANSEVNRLFEEKEKDPSKQGEWVTASLRDKQAAEDLHKFQTAARYAGSEQGRAFRLRQLLANEDFSFASLETQRRAARGGAPLGDAEKAKLSKLSEDYSRADEDLKAHLAGQTKIHPKVLEMAGRILDNLDKRAAAARERIKARAGRFSAGIDPTVLRDVAEIGASHLAHFSADVAKWSAKMIEDVGDWIKPHLPDVLKRSQSILASLKTSDAVKRAVSNPEERALKAFKTRTSNRITELENKLASKDFSKTARNKTVLDREAMELQAKKERLVKQFNAEQEKIRLESRKGWEKALDFASDVKRFNVLTSITVLPKLISAGIQRLSSMPMEELIGDAWSHAPIVSKIAAKAPLEGGGINIAAEMKGYGSAFTKGMKDAYDIMKTGRSDLDVLYGKGNSSYSGETSAGTVALEVPGRIHGMIKAPVKRAAFERAAQILGDFYAKQGLGVTDPLVKTRIATESYKAANRSIFLEDNWLATKVNAFLSAGKDPTIGQKSLSTLGKVTLPIVKVPTNIAAETLRYALGVVVHAPVQIIRALPKGLENLKPEEADAIMRNLKKGSIGAAVLALGYFNADNIGGYYQPNKKQKPGDVKYGSVRMFGHDIPSYLLHNPLLETLQIGATIRRVADAKLRKKDTEEQGLTQGAIAGALGVVDETPFGREIVDVAKVFNPYERKKWFKQQATDATVPKIVQQGYQFETNHLNNAQ